MIVRVQTTKLSMIHLNEGRKNRIELIEQLYDDGLSSKEISYLLNSIGIKTDKGKDFYPNLVWGYRDKHRKRLKRYNNPPNIQILEEKYGWINNQ